MAQPCIRMRADEVPSTFSSAFMVQLEQCVVREKRRRCGPELFLHSSVRESRFNGTVAWPCSITALLLQSDSLVGHSAGKWSGRWTEMEPRSAMSKCARSFH